MRIIDVQDIDSPALAPYARLTERQLKGDEIFIAESPKVIRVALSAGYRPLSFLCERRHITGDAAEILAGCGDVEVYTGERELLAGITGYTLTRGVLCAMRRPELPSIDSLCRGASRIAVLEGVCDTTNTGAIFRSAAALGIDGVVLSEDCCDPLNRRAVRVSMGTVFLVPWCFSPSPMEELKERGFTTLALALCDDSLSLGDERLRSLDKIAMFFGTEGDGLRHETISGADHTVKIPMLHGVDSLNVAAASAVTFWELRKR